MRKPIFAICLFFSTSVFSAEIPDFIQQGQTYLAHSMDSSLIKVIKIDHDWLYLKRYGEFSEPTYAWVPIYSDLLTGIIACNDENLHDDGKQECEKAKSD